MDTTFWINRWQEGRIGFHASQINAHLKAYWPLLKLKPQDQILVPLCGKSLDLLYLKQQGQGVVGVELSQIAIEIFFQENKLSFVTKKVPHFEIWHSHNLRLLKGDFFNLQPDTLGPFSFVYDRAALIALSKNQRQQYAKHFTTLLNEQSQILLITFVYPPTEKEGPPFSVDEQEIHHLFERNFSINKLDSIELIDQDPKYRQWGLSEVKEEVFLLKK